ncbi:coronin-1A-like isoform X2 [Neocloeon triangulifer]|uniref:coronin-1A-like isoform X2 n=1 Tax=Neocloeon triangulifer TaxID=2078957 RepID=UPI00286F1CD2|nr:coronin-1A-like isoform X2 [Neocloeon triangulifer]
MNQVRNSVERIERLQQSTSSCPGESRISSGRRRRMPDAVANSLVDERACNKPKERLAFRGVRSSKFRHVYGQPVRRERCYDNIKITRNAHDALFCAVNPKFVAIVTEVAGGGAFVVLPISQTGRQEFNAGRVVGHSGPVLDIKWDPFNDNIIASASEDCSVKLWHIKDEGFGDHLEDWLAELRGHRRRVTQIEWHPVAQSVLFSAGADGLVVVWTVANGGAILNVIDCHPEAIQCLSLNRDGSLIATTCRDRKLRVIEPRTGAVVSSGECHEGIKPCKVVFLGESGRLLTTGFSRHSDRQYAIWDQDDLREPLKKETIDSSSGVLFPYYDYDTQIIYLAGKGDGNIRYYEVTPNAPYLHYLSQFLSGHPQRGLGVMPKRGLDVRQCEIFRFYKLHATKGLCEPVSMIVPRKSEQFQEDLFPDTAAAKPGLTADEWASGRNKSPVLMSMKTGDVRGVANQQNQANNKNSPSKGNKKPVLEEKTNSANNAITNNKKKFAFLSQETIPDYRPMEMKENEKLSEKSHKTNQNTKFQQIQQMFGSKPNSNSILKDQSIMEALQPEKEILIIDAPKDELELKKEYLQKCEEVVRLKQQIASRDKIIKELESQVHRLKLKHIH